MKMGFTKGPWQLKKHGVITGGPVVSLVGGEVQPQIASACLHESLDSETREANARLIAAAPELYSAATKMCKAIEAVEGTPMELRIALPLSDAFKLLRDAIAKAGGE